MNSLNTKAKVVTALLDRDDLNWNLAQQILDDCKRSGVPSSYRTTVSEIFNRSGVAAGLLDDDGCLFVPLLGIASTSVPTTSKSPNAVILRDRNGEGRTYLQLRGGKILVATQELWKSQVTSRYSVLYLFDDCLALDMIRATKALEEEIWVHEMSAQSRHPSVDEPSPDDDRNAFQLPVIARRMITVVPPEDTAEGDASETPPLEAKAATPDQTGGAQWRDEIPF